MLHVTGVGMVSALGLDAVSSCAAARAGLLRIAPLEGMRVVVPGEEELLPVTGHRVRHLADGLFGYARLLALAAGAVDDLRRSGALAPPGTAQAPVGLLVALPTFAERASWLARVEADPELAADDLDVAAEREGLRRLRERLAQRFVADLCIQAGLAVVPACAGVVPADEVGVVGAFDQAARWIGEGRVDRCVVLGVDSLLDPRTLAARAGLRLLRLPDHAAAPIPGELACALVVEGPGARGALAVIEGSAATDGAPARLGADPPSADPLLAAMGAACGGDEPPHLVVNLNGDGVRAFEWGLALWRRAAQGRPDPVATWVPPAHFGEIGAATGPAGVAMLLAGWRRGYAPAPRALVCLMADGTTRGALCVRRAA